MTRDDEVLLSILLDNTVDLFLSRFCSRRVGGTTCYLPVYEPVVYEVLGLVDRSIGRAYCGWGAVWFRAFRERDEKTRAS